jgi:hypothetical protein
MPVGMRNGGKSSITTAAAIAAMTCSTLPCTPLLTNTAIGAIRDNGLKREDSNFIGRGEEWTRDDMSPWPENPSSHP